MKDQEETPEELLVTHNLKFVKEGEQEFILKPLYDSPDEAVKGLRTALSRLHVVDDSGIIDMTTTGKTKLKHIRLSDTSIFETMDKATPARLKHQKSFEYLDSCGFNMFDSEKIINSAIAMFEKKLVPSVYDGCTVISISLFNNPKHINIKQNKMPKPIVHIQIPASVGKDKQKEIASDIYEYLNHEYYTIVTSCDGNDTKLNVFHEKDFTDVKCQELKKIIEDAVKTEKV